MVNFSSEKWFTQTGFYSYEINSSVRFNADQNSNATRTPSSASNRKIFTWSSWVKRNQLATNMRLFEGFTDTNNFSSIVLGGSDNLQVVFLDSGSAVYNLITTAVLRDTSSWYHIVVAVDTTQSSSSNRVKVYINGEQQTSFGTNTVGSQDFNTEINNNTSHAIGRYLGASQYYLDAYLAEMNFIDGSQLTPDSFGETKQGVWIPKKYSGSYGTNGFYLKFNDASSGNRGDDSSGNGNDFSTSAVNAADTNLPDTPTNNFGTMNINNPSNTGTADFSIGNTKITLADNEEAFGTFGVSSGKWYYEVLHISSASSNNKIAIGIADADNPSNNEQVNFGHQATTYGVGDIISVAVDVDAETITFRKNNTAIETDTDWSSKGFTTIVPFLTSANSAGNEVAMFNFGSDSSFNTNKTPQNNSDENGHGDFFYTPPSGFLAMCAANLPEPSISPLNGEKPADYFNTNLWPGNDGTQDITGVGFQPDWVWVKARTSTQPHVTYDAVRTFAANKDLSITSSAAEGDTSGGHLGDVTAVDADEFTVATGITNAAYTNATGQTYVGWSWLAGNATASNSDGSTSSTISVNQEAGFSIVSFTGTGSATTVGHGLGATPKLIIVKNRTDTASWNVYHSANTAAPQTETLQFDINAATVDSNTRWNDTAPTSSVFTVGTSNQVNGSSDAIIAYCFAEIEGYSKFSSYTGNGSTDGPFVFTGFRPAWVIFKRTDSTGSWFIADIKRDVINPVGKYLFADLTNIENTAADRADFLSNGFKVIVSNTNQNANGGTYIYWAFAEQPFKYANGR
mgnify:CR=1 FL=1|tara:strand:+ start:1146 stop:3536 length:2391 start_codon:yes stop_codon:yes gene_type:complete